MAVRALPKFPAIERDFAIVVDRDFASQRIIDWIENLGESLIEYVQVFDQYIGAPIPDGKKSLAYNICYAPRTEHSPIVRSIHCIKESSTGSARNSAPNGAANGTETGRIQRGGGT